MTLPAIFVLGMHRSGTSALSRVLNLVGFAQANTMMKANDFNPSGYWEPQPVVALNDSYLWDLQRYWGDPKPVNLSDDLSRFEQAVGDAQTVLKEQFDGAQGFVLKDPRVSLTFPIWREAAEAVGAQPVVLIALRNPLSVCQSLRKRDGLKLAHSEKLWMNYTLEAEKNSRGVPRAVVRYEDMLKDWNGTVQAAIARLGLPVPTLDDTLISSVETFLDPALNHGGASDEQLAAEDRFDQSTKDLYACLSQPDGLEQLDELDRLGAAWKGLWAEKSKGKGPSFYAKRFPDWHLRRSAQALAAGDVAGAISGCQAAIEVDPSHAQSHFRLAKLHFDQGDLQDALEQVCAAIDLTDERIHFHMLHARILNKLDRSDEALAQMSRAMICNPDWAEAHFLRGTLLLNLNRRDDAIQALERAIELAPEKANFQKALARAEKMPVVVPPVPMPSEAEIRKEQAAQALRYMNDKNWTAAHKIFAELAAEENAPIGVLRNFSTVLVRLGLVQNAITTLERIVKREPASARHHFQLGAQRVLAADWAGATSAREAGLEQGLPEVQAFLETPEPAQNTPNPFLTQSLFAWQSAGLWHQRLQALDADDEGELWPLGLKRPTVETPAIATISSKDRPELSVMIPVYNVQNETWLRGAIDSVLGQTDPAEAVEVVMVDDASSNDLARDVATDYGVRITYVRNDVQAGLLQNHNRCLELARGEFVHILHQDDWVRGGFYDALLAPLRANPTLAMAFCAARIVDGDDKRVRVPARLAEDAGVLDNWLARIVHGQLINFPTVIARRSAYERVGGFTPSLSFAFDWEMWARLATAGDVWHDPREMAVYRNHAASATQLFTARERMIDTFHTIAGLLPLLPADQASQIGRHALQRVLANGWGQLRQMDVKTEGLDDMIAFLHQGCSSGTDVAKIMALFD
jgi:tetratricopeptide (TPR) repeat protein